VGGGEYDADSEGRSGTVKSAKVKRFFTTENTEGTKRGKAKIADPVAQAFRPEGFASLCPRLGWLVESLIPEGVSYRMIG
jgi:hypothetical protein